MASECSKNGEVNASNEKFESNEGPLKFSTDASSIVCETPNKLESSGGVYSCQTNSDGSLNDKCVFINAKDTVSINEFNEVMQKMSSNHYSISEEQELPIYNKCKLLFEKDYICKVVNNCNYTLNYPTGIIIPIGKKTDIEGSFMDLDGVLYSKLVKEACEIRRRSRFVAPVILFDNKFICRSATLSVKLSTLHEIAAKMVPPLSISSDEEYLKILKDCNVEGTLFKSDVEILKHLKIDRILDLTTRYNKSCPKTLGFVTSEIAFDSYGSIKVEEMPYTGSNYFPCYHQAGRFIKDLKVDWKKMDADRLLNLTEDPAVFFPEINVHNDHKNWDLCKLTQNYLKIMLSQLVTDTGGMVIHCASGWDRTPLFVSLLRLSLWADGVVHESLEFQDIAYLTVAYDWYLFGHKFPLRHQTNQEIMHFSFNFLECITSDEYSITRLFQELPAEKKRNRVFPKFMPGRRIKLNKIRDLFMEIYDAEIIKKKEL